MIEVLAPGVLATVQDTGRRGHQAEGIGSAGAMDVFAARVANALLGNPDDAPLLEITLGGAAFRALATGWFALAGADVESEVDGEALRVGRPFRLPAGQVLRLGRVRAGCRTYLAVRGGFAADRVFGSASTDLRGGFGGHQGRALQRGDLLDFSPADAEPRVPAGAVAAFGTVRRRAPAPLALLPGPALDALAPQDRARVFVEPFTVSADSDRMGLRLGPPLASAAALPQQLSSAVVFGTLQLPPDGCGILLGADRQTTGGYPVAGVVAGVDHWRIAQARPGDSLRFRPCNLPEAQQAWRQRERGLGRLRVLAATWWQA